MAANNLFVSLGVRAAHEHLSHNEMRAALRKVLPGRSHGGDIRFTDAEIDAIHEAFDLIRDINLSYDEAFGIDMLCAIIPILWKILHVELASIWRFRTKAGDPRAPEAYDLHRRRAAGENVGIADFWKCCPWLPAWEEKFERMREDSGQLSNQMGTSLDKDGCD